MPRKTQGNQVGSVCCHCPPPCCESSRMLGPCITHPAQDKRASALNCASTACSGASFSCLQCSGEWLEGDRASARSVGETNSGWWGRGKQRCLWRQQESDFGGQLGTGQGTVSKHLCGRHWGLGHMALSTTPTLHPEIYMYPEISSMGHFPVGCISLCVSTGLT